MKERLFNIKIQQIIAVLVCSILIGSGVSVSNYLSKSELEQPSNKVLLDKSETVGLQSQKYSVHKGTTGLSNRHFPPDIYNSIVNDYSINLNT